MEAMAERQKGYSAYENLQKIMSTVSSTKCLLVRYIEIHHKNRSTFQRV